MTDALKIAEEALRNLPRYEIDQDGGSDLDSIGQWVKFDDLDPIIEAVALSRSTAGDEARDADSRRLDWLDTAGMTTIIEVLDPSNYTIEVDDMIVADGQRTIREAIDAAIAASRAASIGGGREG